MYLSVYLILNSAPTSWQANNPFPPTLHPTPTRHIVTWVSHHMVGKRKARFLTKSKLTSVRIVSDTDVSLEKSQRNQGEKRLNSWSDHNISTPVLPLCDKLLHFITATYQDSQFTMSSSDENRINTQPWWHKNCFHDNQAEIISILVTISHVNIRVMEVSKLLLN